MVVDDRLRLIVGKMIYFRQVDSSPHDRKKIQAGLSVGSEEGSWGGFPLCHFRKSDFPYL